MAECGHGCDKPDPSDDRPIFRHSAAIRHREVGRPMPPSSPEGPGSIAAASRGNRRWYQVRRRNTGPVLLPGRVPQPITSKTIQPVCAAPASASPPSPAAASRRLGSLESLWPGPHSLQNSPLNAQRWPPNDVWVAASWCSRRRAGRCIVPIRRQPCSHARSAPSATSGSRCSKPRRRLSPVLRPPVRRQARCRNWNGPRAGSPHCRLRRRRSRRRPPRTSRRRPGRAPGSGCSFSRPDWAATPCSAAGLRTNYSTAAATRAGPARCSATSTISAPTGAGAAFPTSARRPPGLA